MLKQRLLTALVLVAALLVILLVLPRMLAVAVLALLVLQGAWEWSAFLKTGNTAARAAYVRGTPPAAAASAFALPASLGEWAMFNKVFFERAFAAWARELGAGRG